MADTLTLTGAKLVRPFPPFSAAAELVGRSNAIARVHELLRRAAGSDAGTLITGEAGSAVESVAHELHGRSRHATAPFVVVECGAVDAVGVDRLLFGSPPDSPAGSAASAPIDLESVTTSSRIAAAIGGTLFLHDVSELPASTQARLARLARDGEVRIDGAAVATRLRLVASATPAIDGDVHAHRFRADLYRRLSATRVDLPPLRDRAEDVPLIAQRLLEELSAAEGSPARTFTQTALALLGALTWPGNFAELRGAIERVVAETRAEVIQVEHLLPALQLLRAPAPFVPSGNLREARLRFERDYIAAVLQHHGWRMADAAQTLGIQRPNLYRKARQLGIPLARLSD